MKIRKRIAMIIAPEAFSAKDDHIARLRQTLSNAHRTAQDGMTATYQSDHNRCEYNRGFYNGLAVVYNDLRHYFGTPEMGMIYPKQREETITTWCGTIIGQYHYRHDMAPEEAVAEDHQHFTDDKVETCVIMNVERDVE